MIKKIISIKNIARFVDYSCSHNVEFRKLTLIYAENGRGKTMLSSIFRSLCKREGKYIKERSTLGSSGTPQVSILLEGEIRADFNDGVWDNALENLEIFDSTFVEENVFSGCSIEHSHKTNLYRFVVGKEGCKLAQKVDTLYDNIKRKNEEIRGKKGDIQKDSGKLQPEDFVNLEQEEDIDSKIASETEKLEAFKKKKEIEDKATLSLLLLSDIPIEDLNALLSKRLEDISEDAERKTRQHIEHCMGSKGESWVRDGLAFAYIEEDQCPFCGQSLEGIELVKAYRDYFSDAYKDLKTEIDGFSSRIQGILSQDNILKVLDTIGYNKSLVEFWKAYIQEVAFPEIAFDELKNTWNKLFQLLDNHLKLKAASPLEVINVSEPLRLTIQSYGRVLANVATYNQGVETVNILIDKQKQQIRIGCIDSVQNELSRLQNIKKRFEPAVNQLCIKYSALKEEKSRAENENKQAKEELDDYTKKIFEKYEKSINSYLKKFSAGFRIINTKSGYQGGTPRSTYCISINDTVVELGRKNTTDETPCFKNTLSAGDKSTLAFAFFLARLDQDPNLGNNVVVFDDPISSLDRHRKQCTQQQIIRISQLTKQVIVLSHDPYFLLGIWKGVENGATKNLYIKRSGLNNSVIQEWDIEQETQSEYLKNYFTLDKFLEEGQGDDLRAIARCIRPLLEGNLRIRCPKEFKSNEWLGDLIGKIRDAASDNPLYCLKSMLTELSDINDYSKKYHHVQNPSAGSEPINDTELRSYANRTLKLTSGI